MTRCLFGTAFFGCILLASTSALADPKASAPGREPGYRYVFLDDPLSAGGFDAKDTRIRVVPGAARTTLLRPRTDFVGEMLVSVEKL